MKAIIYLLLAVAATVLGVCYMLHGAPKEGLLFILAAVAAIFMAIIAADELRPELNPGSPPNPAPAAPCRHCGANDHVATFCPLKD